MNEALLAELPKTELLGDAPAETAEKKLFCTICGERIPPPRDRRPTATCSEKCKDALDQIRAEQRRERKCPHCLHPSTPEERADYRAWRAERGKVKSATILERDRSWPPKQHLRAALKSAVGFLEELRDSIHAEPESSDLQSNAEVEKQLRDQARKRAILAGLLSRCKELLDTKRTV